MKRIYLAALAVMVFTVSCNNKNNTAAPGEAAPADQTAAAGSSSAPVAYFNIDSLVSKYDMYLDQRAAYEAKAKKADTELTNKGKALQNDVQSYQEKVQKGLMTTSQMRTTEENLNKKQQAFLQQRDKVMAELAEEEQVILNTIHYNITEFLKEFNKDYRYSVIMSTSAAGPILNADPSLDLTATILEGLNKKYAAEKGSAPADNAQ